MPHYIIYLIGKPGVGKYTTAQEIAKSGYVICDNQLINNPIFTLVGYDGFGNVSDDAWNAIKKIRDSVFDFIECEPHNNYVLTNVLNDDEGDRALFIQVEGMTKKRGSIFVPIKLTVSKEEHLKRIQEPSRRVRYKSIDPQDVYDSQELLFITHKNLLQLDTTQMSAVDTAKCILDHCAAIQKINFLSGSDNK
jgi:hypothetical protein